MVRRRYSPPQASNKLWEQLTKTDEGELMKRTICCVVFLFGFAQISSAADTTSPEFYKGKPIRLVVGSSSGGAQDDWARFVAQYLGKHVPGSPDIVVQNMPGAGTIIAANYIYNIAKPDGLTFGLINPAIYIDQLLGAKEVKFDWPKFSWIGFPERIDQVCSFARTLRTKTWRIFARRRSRRGARLWGVPVWVIYCRGSSKRDSGLSFIWWWATAAAAR